MKELDFLNVIKDEVGTKYIGDDCAYIQEHGIVVSQDSLIEGIHFNRDWYTSYQLGYKAAAVNISDILASGAIPKFMTIALSLTKDIDENFIREFYRGANSVSKDVCIIGGDITGSKNDIVISITAIGSTKNRNISSRKNAKPEYIVITKGLFGSSAEGLSELMENSTNNKFIEYHIKPNLDFDFSTQIATKVKSKYAMTDCSDGLADALYKIAQASHVSINIDYNLIPHADCVTREQVLFGGEDYNLLACIPKQDLKNISNYIQIGKVTEQKSYLVKFEDYNIYSYDDIKSFNHFKE